VDLVLVGERCDRRGRTSKGEPFPQAITVDALLGLLATLPDGLTELGCHPAAEAEADSAYGAERQRELEALCDPRVRAAVGAERIVLCAFASFSGARPA
jgi:predicted glycoside hydrolase/deacetylase ChbG (UPF0249 family)